MTLEQMEKFNGKGSQFEEYDKLINKADRLQRQISKLSDEIYDEDCSISVFVGELSKRDHELYMRHVIKRKELVGKRYLLQGDYEGTLKKILDLQK